jgi:hypothetical protein
MAFRGAITMKDIWEDRKLQERLAARLMAHQLRTEFCVTPNASVSGASQVSSDGSTFFSTRGTTTDCSRRKRKIDVEANGRPAAKLSDNPLKATGPRVEIERYQRSAWPA